MDVHRVVIADDHVMFRQGMKALIDEKPDLKWWEKPVTDSNF